jgi:hypothetical protein
VFTTPAQKVFLKTSHYFTVFDQLDRFDVDLVEKPYFKLLSKLSSFIRKHLHLKVPMEVCVSEIPMCINDLPKCLALESLNDVNVALFRASSQLYAVGPLRLQYLFVQHQLTVYRQGRPSSHEAIHFLHSSPSSSRFFFTCAFQRRLASSVMSGISLSLTEVRLRHL